MVFGSILVVVYLYGKTTYDLCLHEFIICVCTDQIQTSCLVLRRTTSLFTSGNTLSKPPHRNTFLENPIKNGEGGCEGIGP
jgi:hypothetical protein